MLQRYKIFPLLLLIAMFGSSCDDNPSSGSNGVPNTITGKVRLINADTEMPLDDNGGVQITIKGTAFSTTTNSLGEYTFNAIPPGVYVLIYSKTGYDSALTAVNYSGVGVEFVGIVEMRSIKKIHRLQGFAVLVASNGDTVADLHDIDVRILQTSQHTVTDQEGRYSFSDVPAGEYDLRFIYAGFDTVVAHLYYSGVGVQDAPTAYLRSLSWVSLTRLFYVGDEHEWSIFEAYSDSVRGDNVWVGGTPLSKSGKYIVAIGGTQNIPYSSIDFELTDYDPQTADPVIPALASMEKLQYIKYYDYNVIASHLDGDLAGKQIYGRMKAFVPSLNMNVHSNRESIPRK
jgi:hypothetical protein